MRISLLTLCLLVGAWVSAQTFRWNDAQPKTPVTAKEDPLADETGYAIYYADYLDGNPTALGETYYHNQMTAGHAKLPLGTIVKVTRIDNGLSTTVRINDRGAYSDGCIIDLSQAAARQIDLMRVGRSKVKLTVVGFSTKNPPAPVGTTTAAASTTPAQGASQVVARMATPAPVAYEYPPTRPVASQPASTTQSAPVWQAKGSTSTTTTAAQNAPAQSAATQTRTVATAAPSTQATTDQVTLLTTPISAFAVQLGSYGQFSNAERHVVALQRKGFNGIFVYQEKKADGTTINRVIVAPFASVTEAQHYLADLRNVHQMEGLVVQMK